MARLWFPLIAFIHRLKNAAGVPASSGSNEIAGQNKQDDLESRMDAKILRALRTDSFWTAAALADGLREDQDVVIQSLWRLEFHGEAQSVQLAGEQSIRFYWRSDRAARPGGKAGARLERGPSSGRQIA